MGKRITFPQRRTMTSASSVAFVELCARSAFSGVSIVGIVEEHGARGWTGSALPEQLAERAAAASSRGQGDVGAPQAFAITDLWTLAGVVRAEARARELGVRCIVGCELWLPEGPLVLHAATHAGYSNLCAILTDARQGLEKGSMQIVLDDVLRRAHGLWALVLPPFQARRLGDVKDAFAERCSLGIFRHDTPEDGPRNAWCVRHARRLEVPLLATSRAFLGERSDKRLHDVLTCIRQGLRLQEAGQRLLPNGEAHVRDGVVMGRLFADHPEALQRSVDVAAACTFGLSELRYAFPAETIEGESADVRLRRLTLQGARERYGVIPDDVKAQLTKEFATITELDVAPYFLTVQAIVALAREQKILCQGRGSAANSVVCYCLGITSIDPVKMGLLFERFLSKERGDPPDIDVDFEHERREEVIQAIYQRWGRSHAAMVSEVIAFRGKSAVREVGKVFGLTETLTSRIAGLLSHANADTLPAELQSLGVDIEQVTETLHHAQLLQGHPRHLGIHVGGFVLTRDPITTVAPVEPARMPDRTVIPWDKDDVDTLGFFKMDVLGLGMLTCIRKSFDLIELHGGQRWELHTIPQDDPLVYDALCQGDSVGVFQVESRAQMAMLPRLKPRCFYDLVVQVALVRPGPIQGDMVHPYLRRRAGIEPPTLPHESLRPILERTLGVPLFQEQVMRIAIVGAGYSGGEADQLRRDMAAWKKTGRLDRHRSRLLAGFKARGISDNFGDRLFEQIKGFGGYGFPESHAASFAILVYASAWLKRHHPAAFAAALINSQPMGFYPPAQIIRDLQAHDVEVLPLGVNDSFWDCTIERRAPSSQAQHAGQPGAAHPPADKLALRVGLRVVKGLAETKARILVQERQGRGDFIDVSDVSRRCGLDQKSQQALAKAGAFDVVSAHRRAAIWNSMVPRLPLLQYTRDDDVGDAVPAANSAALLLLDYTHTGMSLHDHPMKHVRAGLQSMLKREQVLTAKEIHEVKGGTRAVTAGLVIGRQRPSTADGTCFVTLEDETGTVNVIVWGRDFERWRVAIVTASFLLFRGVVEREGIVVHFIAKDVAVVAADLGGSHGIQLEMFGGRPDEKLPFKARNFH